MVVVMIAKSGASWSVIGAADERNGLNQGHLQGQEGVNCDGLSSSKRSLKPHSVIAAQWPGLRYGHPTSAFINTGLLHRNIFVHFGILKADP